MRPQPTAAPYALTPPTRGEQLMQPTAAPTQINPASLLAFSEVSCRFLREMLSGQHNDLLRRRVS
jgi:hypothetical protein